MPYVPHSRRNSVTYGAQAFNAGELNYLLTTVCRDYLYAHGETYQVYNDIMGALEGCKMELYRRKIAEYENGKIKENGDVF